jgi:hypothetical protein
VWCTCVPPDARAADIAPARKKNQATRRSSALVHPVSGGRPRNAESMTSTARCSQDSPEHSPGHSPGHRTQSWTSTAQSHSPGHPQCHSPGHGSPGHPQSGHSPGHPPVGSWTRSWTPTSRATPIHLLVPSAHLATTRSENGNRVGVLAIRRNSANPLIAPPVEPRLG